MPYWVSKGTTNHMKNLILFVALMLSFTLFTSCATLFSKKRTVTVTSDVDGADVFIGSKYVGKTPLSYETKKTEMTITVQKKGYAPQEIFTNRSIKGVVWLDCLAGGIPGIVDLCSGKYYKYKETDYFVSLKDPRINQAHNDRINKKYEWVTKVAAPLAAVTMSGVTTYANAKQAENAKKAAMEKARQEQERAESYAKMQANYLENQQRLEAREQQERDRMTAATRRYNEQTYGNRSTSSRKMETSDLAQHNAARMSDAIYGTAATNQALAQQRRYDAQQNQQARINEQRMLDQQLGTTENAITSSGARIQIKVKNGVVTAYSTSNSNYSGTGPEWNRVSSPVSRTTDNRYGYEANLVGVGKVFWGESRPVISNHQGGVAVNAVTINGETIQIRVENEVVIAYRKNGNLPWNGRAVSAKKTNVTYDGEQIASRFKYKADLPGIGTVYF